MSVRALPCALLALLAGCRTESEPAPPAVRVASAYDTAIETVADSVHGGLDCSACHAATGRQATAPNDVTGEASCAGCHAEAVASHEESVHFRTEDGGRAATCLQCHGAHDIYPSSDPRSHTHKFQIAATCGRCHQNPELARYLGMKVSEAASDYAESIHGRALLRGGLTVAPSCVDCHSGHGARRASAAGSPVNARNVVATCGNCHEGVALRLERSVHGSSAGGAVVTCVTCHSAHSIQAPAREYKLEADRRCGGCHQSELATHLQTYHGRAHALQSGEVAACYDCHGNHEIVPTSEALSPVSPSNKLATCGNCHEGAPASFAQYLAHPDRRDAVRYPALHFVYRAMTALIGALIAIFGVHAFAWTARVLIEYLRAPSKYREERARRRRHDEERRLPGLRSVDRFCYFALLGAVVSLVATGMPLKFPLSAWAADVFSLLGGASVARNLHRAAAVVALVVMAIHLTSVAVALWQRQAVLDDETLGARLRRAIAPASGSSPWLGAADFRAFWAHTRWFVGRGPEPTFARFTYWEKLDYVAAMLVLAVLVASGVVLWFPETALALFPGYVLNVAQLIHGDEAMILVLSVLSYHLLHVLVLSRLLVPKRAGSISPPESAEPPP